MSGMKIWLTLAAIAIVSAMLAAAGSALGVRAKAAVQPPAEGAQRTAPMELVVAAYQLDDHVVVVARGTNRTTGYTTRLELADADADPAEVILRNEPPPPGMMAGQAITPFDATAYFKCQGEKKRVRVRVAGEGKDAEVRPLREMPPAENGQRPNTPASPGGSSSAGS